MPIKYAQYTYNNKREVCSLLPTSLALIIVSFKETPIPSPVYRPAFTIDASGDSDPTSTASVPLIANKRELLDRFNLNWICGEPSPSGIVSKRHGGGTDWIVREDSLKEVRFC